MKKNRLIALLSALVLVFSTFSVPVFGAVNEDVVGTDYESAVGKLKAVDVMGGYPDGSFKPEGNITRAEFSRIAVDAMGLGEAAEASKGATKFPDVPADAWYSGYVNVAADRGIISGYPDGTFNPNGNLKYSEAITILVRMVGLGPVVDKEGTWPSNYIGRAANEGILDDVFVAGSATATRGNVAVLLNNTLTVEMWGAAGYDDDGSVNYGKTGDTLLEDRLDITQVKEARVTGYNVDDNELTITGVAAEEVAENVVVDLYDAYLNEVTVWVNSDDEIIFVDVTSDYFIDAIEINDDSDEVTLVDADEDYDVDQDVVIYVNGDEEDIDDLGGNDYDYAKVVLNEDDDVVFIDAYNWDGSIYVTEVDDGVVFGYEMDAGDAELDVEDYVIVKDGKTISLDDVAEKDILYYDEDEEFAEVFAKVIEGDLDNIFTDAFEVDGEEYDIVVGEVTYFDADGDIAELNADALEDMEEAGGVVTLFLARNGAARHVDGDVEESTDSTIAGYLTEDITTYDNRNQTYLAIDMVNENGVEVSYDPKVIDVDLDFIGDIEAWAIDVANVGEFGGATFAFAQEAAWDDYTSDEQDEIVLHYVQNVWAGVTAGSVVEVTIDEDGDLTELTVGLSSTGYDYLGVEDDMVELSDKYIESKRLSSSVIVFYTEEYTDDADDIVATTWGNVDQFGLVDVGTVYFDGDNYVTYLVVDESDNEAEETDYVGVVTDVDELSSEDEWKIKIFVDGTEKTYYTDEDDVTNVTVVKGDAVDFTVDDNSGLITAISAAAEAETDEAITALSVSDKTVTAGSTYELVSEGFVYDITDVDDIKEIKLRDLEVDDQVTIIEDETGFAKFILMTYDDSADEEPADEDASATLEGNYFMSGVDAITVKIDVGTTGLDQSDFSLVVYEEGAFVKTQALAAAALDPAGEDFVVGDNAGGTDLALADDSAYTIKVIKVSDGSVLAEKDIVTGNVAP